MEYTFSKRMSGLRGSAIREIFKYAADPAVISLAGGNPAPELFPAKELALLASEILSKEPVTALQYGITEGYPKLRELLKKTGQDDTLARQVEQTYVEEKSLKKAEYIQEFQNG